MLVRLTVLRTSGKWPAQVMRPRFTSRTLLPGLTYLSVPNSGPSDQPEGALGGWQCVCVCITLQQQCHLVGSGLEFKRCVIKRTASCTVWTL